MGIKYERFTSSGTYTKPQGARPIIVEAIGAGGDGGENVGGAGAAGGRGEVRVWSVF